MVHDESSVKNRIDARDRHWKAETNVTEIFEEPCGEKSRSISIPFANWLLVILMKCSKAEGMPTCVRARDVLTRKVKGESMAKISTPWTVTTILAFN